MEEQVHVAESFNHLSAILRRGSLIQKEEEGNDKEKETEEEDRLLSVVSKVSTSTAAMSLWGRYCLSVWNCELHVLCG